MFDPASQSIARAIGSAKQLQTQKMIESDKDDYISEDSLFSSVSDETMLSAVQLKAQKDSRAMAAAIVLEWAKSETNDFDELEAMIAGSILNIDYAADTDEEEHKIDPEKLSGDEEKEFEELLELVSDAIILFSGVEPKKIQTFIDDEKNEMALEIIELITEKTNGESEDELVADFSVREDVILSATKKVVRDGKIKLIKKPIRKRKMTAKQRQALKKARKKAHSSAAKAKRKKSNRVRARS